MRYEHLVQINDLDHPDIPLLGRAQLWLGLVARAERPAMFDASIDAMRLVRREGDVLERELTRGSWTTRETVRLRPDASIEIGIEAGSDFGGSTLCIAIEEPAPQALFLRFTYALAGSAVPADEGEQQALRQAYYFADIETVRRIRALAPVGV